jgi:hypothetical protein
MLAQNILLETRRIPRQRYYAFSETSLRKSGPCRGNRKQKVLRKIDNFLSMFGRKRLIETA